MIVTVDGPAGTGKSTVSRVLANRTGLPHLDTGAFYRAATVLVIRAGADPTDAIAVVRSVADLWFDQIDGRMYVDGDDLSEAIRSETVTANVSAVSAHPALRERMVSIQRDWIKRHDGDGVVEGRDIGSVVFPDADLKIYLDASPEVRAERRARQSGEDTEEVLIAQRRRDEIDSTRESSPLTVPEDAVVVDTSELTFEEVVDLLVELVASRS